MVFSSRHLTKTLLDNLANARSSALRCPTRSLATTRPTRSGFGAQGSYSAKGAHLDRSLGPFWALAAAGATLLGYHTWAQLHPTSCIRLQESSGSPLYTKEQVGVICILGGPQSGKSTQIANITERFRIDQVAGDAESVKAEISKKMKSAKQTGKVYLVTENYPQTIEQLEHFEEKVVPILLYIYVDIDPEKAAVRTERTGDKAFQEAWTKFNDDVDPIIKKFRFQGNILEITGEWPADEVWEQVEAKLESALELDERGEL